MEKLESVLREVLHINTKEVDENEKFINMEIWDSMTFMFFITELEDKLEISLTNQEILDIDCIKSTKEIILRKLEEK